MAVSKGSKKGRHSPAMQQFFRAKQEYPDALLFFRMGDFYETFFEDAVEAAQLLDIALTSRGSDEHGVAIPMAGVPHHAATGYIARLVAVGRSVAVCEQMADPSTVKGVVPREVVRVVTPSQVIDEEALDARDSNYLVAVTAEQTGVFGLAVLELSTAELRATSCAGRSELLAELSRLAPREVLLPKSREGVTENLDRDLRQWLPKCAFRAAAEGSSTGLASRFEAMLQEAAQGDHALPAVAIEACAAALNYAQFCQPKVALPVQRVAPYDPTSHLALDEAAARNLELVQTLGGQRKGSLLHHLDLTKTAMGARLLRHRLLAPLCQLRGIRRRHDVVERLVYDLPLREQLAQSLSEVSDLERLSTRAALGAATPRDLGAIATSLGAAAQVWVTVSRAAQGLDADVLHQLTPEDLCEDIAGELRDKLVEQPPIAAGGGGIFRASVDPRIAELRELSESSKDVLLRLEEEERQRTGIASLKIRFTKVFGYYIEISKSKLSAVPDDYVRKQTVAGGERYTTPALQALQAKILNADERLRALEQELFERLRARVGELSPRLRRLAQSIADLDVHVALAEAAHRFGYVRPEMNEGVQLLLRECRHPIVETMVESGTFVPNDVWLDADEQRLMVITGPNMAGKSTTMRQVALAVIMAQAGGFVPAQEAQIGLVDRIYTRVGASDNLAHGQSTFMVEMRETAEIMRGATRRSLVILDEIGRGTSTYDGLSIAWAVAEHLHDVIACRAMFATHYHELCDLAEGRAGIVNCNVAAREYQDDVVFLRKLLPGGANRSYGIAVAKLAGLPQILIARARAILHSLEAEQGAPGMPHHASPEGQGAQLDMFAVAQPVDSPTLRTLAELDLDRMTPVEALLALSRLQALLKEEEQS